MDGLSHSRTSFVDSSYGTDSRRKTRETCGVTIDLGSESPNNRVANCR